MNVICTIAILYAGNYHDTITLKGVVVDERGDNFVVNFSKEFSKRGLNLFFQNEVLSINGNACVLEKK